MISLAASAGACTIYFTTTSKQIEVSVDLKSKRIVIIGGGIGGIGVSAMLGNNGFTNVYCIEPKDKHYYQPIWWCC